MKLISNRAPRKLHIEEKSVIKRAVSGAESHQKYLNLFMKRIDSGGDSDEKYEKEFIQRADSGGDS